ncbi:MAG: S-methyl-5-thioribose-1-phosphate isomerase [Myxococcaceae bacterium]|nr:MAG: S-methyl-5-thioribose-1-phosphate isomerase [Myxococcaceae bacterium]
MSTSSSWKPVTSMALRMDGERLLLLDQRRLPDEERWIDASDPLVMEGCIRTLAVRGAPLLGVAAALCLGLLVRSGCTPASFRASAALLRAARPTAVNLMAAIDRLTASALGDDLSGVDEVAMDVFLDDVARCEAMAAHGASLLEDGSGVITHCNTGGLATVGVGTALGVIHRAHAQGKRVHVYVDETRPLLQGGRLTAWELRHLGIPHTLITDSMAAVVLRSGRASRVLVGSDRVARNGDFANKVGTYSLAVAAAHHHVPFHPVAPWTTVDLSCPDGDAIPIEQRDADEVRGASGSFGSVRWCPRETEVFNPSFDVTPVALVTSLVTDRGVFSREQLRAGALGALDG